MRNVAVSLALALAACGNTVGNGGADLAQVGGDDAAVAHDMATPPGADMTTPPGADMTTPPGDMATAQPLSFTTIFTIVLENTSYTSVVGNNKDAPFLNSLIASGGLATNYSDCGTHPSLPNYLYMTSGDPQYPGIVDCEPTQLCDFTVQFPVDKENLGHQLTTAGVKWRAYMDSMGSACKLNTSSPYAPKHNPFVYFTNIQKDKNGLCAQVDVDYAANFGNDLQAGDYRYMWITPDLNHDGHDTDLKTADTWCAQEVPKILNSATYKAGGVLFITWDEGENGDSHVPMIIVSPKIKQAGMQSATKLGHGSYLATVEDLFKLPRLAGAANAKNLYEFFQ